LFIFQSLAFEEWEAQNTAETELACEGLPLPSVSKTAVSWKLSSKRCASFATHAKQEEYQRNSHRTKTRQLALHLREQIPNTPKLTNKRSLPDAEKVF